MSKQEQFNSVSRALENCVEYIKTHMRPASETSDEKFAVLLSGIGLRVLINPRGLTGQEREKYCHLNLFDIMFTHMADYAPIINGFNMAERFAIAKRVTDVQSQELGL